MSKAFEKLVEAKTFDTNVKEYDQKVDMFLSKYYICETYVKELQKLYLYENNRDVMLSQFKILIGKKLTEELLVSRVNKLNMTKFKVYRERQNNIDVGVLKKIIPNPKFKSNDLDMIFHSKAIKKSENENIKTARILRNEIVHSLSLAAIKEIKERTDELNGLMNRFIGLFKSE